MIDIEPGRHLQPGTIALTDGVRFLLPWNRYDVGGQISRRASEAEIFSAWNLVVREDTGDALVILATLITSTDTIGAANKIKSFMRKHGTHLFACLRPVEFDDTMRARQAGADRF